MKLILASSSKQRRDIFDMIGWKYEILTSDEEEQSNQKDPNKYVEELSLTKAVSVSKKVNEKAIIIAADTVICLNGKIYEKPKNKEEATSNLKELSGNKNTAWTGVTIIDQYKNKIISYSTSTDIYFKKLKDNEIEWYVNSEEKILKCCGYVPQGKAALFIEKVDGDYNNLLGLSPSELFTKLKELGYSINDFDFKDEKDWSEYQNKTYDSKICPLLTEFLSKYKISNSIDLGCGSGNETVHMIKSGIEVLAIDKQLNRDFILNRLLEEERQNVKFMEANFENIQLPQTDLITAFFSIPFCNPDNFDALWDKIFNSINKGGYFVGQLFGDRDDWNSVQNINTFTIEKAKKYLNKYEILKFEEVEYVRKTDNKKWHYYNIIARKG